MALGVQRVCDMHDEKAPARRSIINYYYTAYHIYVSYAYRQAQSATAEYILRITVYHSVVQPN